METVVAPKAAKWPFLFADVCLIAFGAGILFLSPQPPGIWIATASGTAILAGALFSVWPYVLEYKAAAKLVETGALQDAMDKIQQLEEVAQHISGATSQWQTIQETSQKTVQTAQDITERIASEARAFSEFLKKTNEAEQSHLRLEIEKYQRSQTDWLHVTVAILDHTHALHQAAVRSGQPNLVGQLGQFQEACRDVVRRVGLAPFIPGINDFFDGRLHQLLDPDQTPPAGSQIGALIAPGYSFQGQLVRRAVVALAPLEEPAPRAEAMELPAAADPS
jgi:molecular chaperone GrpE (heat shock protein)